MLLSTFFKYFYEGYALLAVGIILMLFSVIKGRRNQSQRSNAVFLVGIVLSLVGVWLIFS